MKKMILLFTAAILIGLASCKKDTPVQPVPVTASKQLKKITKTENGITTAFNFVYDGNRRLQSYRSADNTTGIDFTYDGNGNLTKAVNTEDDFINTYTYVYNNGVPATGTFKSWKRNAGEPDELVEDDKLSYTVVNGQVTGIHVSFEQTGDAADFALTYNSAGNLVKINGAGNAYTASFEYGTKKPVFPITSRYVLDQAGFSLQFAAKNDLRSISFDFPGTQYDELITNQYTYSNEGYVLTSNDGQSSIVFEYQ
jgi:YD repeat-containing protein